MGSEDGTLDSMHCEDGSGKGCLSGAGYVLMGFHGNGRQLNGGVF